jgi:ribonuclease P protein component
LAIQSLKKSNEFRHVFSTGNKKTGKYILVYMMPGQQEDNRLGIVIKKEIGNAVQRNKIKRILREIWRNSCNKLIIGYDVVILVRKKIIYARFSEVETELVKLIQT